MKILIACECSGRVRDAFIARGHEAISCDIKPTETPGPHYECDVRDVISMDWDMMIAHPVCTRLANSGVRWLHERNLWDELDAAVEFYNLFRNADHIPMRAIENPVMHKYARERIGVIRRQVVQPHWFGEKAFKATGFELFGLPELQRTYWLDIPKKGTEEHKRWSAVHREPPGPNRAANRSRTFRAVAEAMAEQWGGLKP